MLAKSNYTILVYDVTNGVLHLKKGKTDAHELNWIEYIYFFQYKSTLSNHYTYMC